MHLDHRQFGGVQRSEQGDRGVRIGAGIDHDAGITFACRLDAVDQRALVVALEELDFYPQTVGFGTAGLLDVGERLASVDLGLPLAQHVEVGPVEYQHRLSSRRAPGGLCGQICLPVLRVPGLISWRLRATRQAHPASLRVLAWANSRSVSSSKLRLSSAVSTL